MARFGRVLLAGLGVVVGGCASPGPSAIDYTVRHGQAENRAAMIDTAEAALARNGYHLESRDNVGGVVKGLTDTGPASGDSAQHDVGLSRRNQIRRAAEIKIDQSMGHSDVYCRVMIQEQATSGYRMFGYDHGGSDRPGDTTAIDRDAATTAAQNTVWRPIRRDKTAERELLDAILGPGGT
ncbi:MAG: hypothetical protein HY287_08250 [Planctomycetes bacterium]|nr:hypothetical protein [Planctomycetota bacterium]MBI3834305.1 hypothetical protein [Planctomycetota bacterium]